MSDERRPLLQSSEEASRSRSTQLADQHTQFCQLIGTRPLNLPPDQKYDPHPDSLYYRAVSKRDQQKYTYMFTATLTNTLILSQVILGATLTALGASNSSHILVAIFGALNTVIAGLIGFLKSRGQPMRARMFRDDLERVVDEIENSSIMWLGISRGSHGYDAIDTDDQVTVRGEVARLTRLYDKAVKTNTLNDPDTYSTGAPGDMHSAALRDKTAVAVPLPAAAPLPSASVPVVVVDDASPATKPPEPSPPKPDDPPPKDATTENANPKVDETSKDATGSNGDHAAPTSRGEDSTASGAKSEQQIEKPNTTPQSTPAAPKDPDESPASAAQP